MRRHTSEYGKTKITKSASFLSISLEFWTQLAPQKINLNSNMVPVGLHFLHAKGIANW